MTDHNIQCISQLLAQNSTSRALDAPQYCWTHYFNSDYTFSPYKLKKNHFKETEKITAGYLRYDLLCKMIKIHNSLYDESGHYKGKLECSFLLIYLLICIRCFTFYRIDIFGLCVPAIT